MLNLLVFPYSGKTALQQILITEPSFDQVPNQVQLNSEQIVPYFQTRVVHTHLKYADKNPCSIKGSKDLCTTKKIQNKIEVNFFLTDKMTIHNYLNLINLGDGTI